MLKRKIEKTLNENYKNKNNKIIILTGARQIGKSFIIRETAKSFFENYIEINLKDDFDSDKKYEKVFDIKSFYLQISADYGDKLGDINNTIIFLDEIQVYPHLISLLKSLKLDGRYRFIASGSLLGITLKHVFIPMGSIEEVKMFPLDFEEFLWANNVGSDTIAYLEECFEKKEQIYENIHVTFLNLFKQYLICGGLPDSVNEFLKPNIVRCRENQTYTYAYYKDDASKYDEQHNLKIKNIFDSLPSYMENKVKRIQFKKIENKEDTNLKKYQDEFDYLISSGIVLQTRSISNPKFPLIESMSKNLIKLYYNDVGILTNILYKNNINVLLNADSGVNLGSVYETVVATELIAHGHELYYFDSKKVGEVDFLLNDYDLMSPIAVEIKSGKDQTNFRAIPKLVKEPYNLKKGYVFGNKNIIKVENNLIYMPIYLIMFL